MLLSDVRSRAYQHLCICRVSENRLKTFWSCAVVNHRERNPLLGPDRLDPSMDMYFLFTGLRCEHLTDCSAQLSQAASGMVKSGHEIRGQHEHVIVIVNDSDRS